jgi:hypothetical protein
MSDPDTAVRLINLQSYYNKLSDNEKIILYNKLQQFALCGKYRGLSTARDKKDFIMINEKVCIKIDELFSNDDADSDRREDIVKIISQFESINDLEVFVEQSCKNIIFWSNNVMSDL